MELISGLEPFVAIIEEGSISAAARRLGLPRATLSRRLSALEDELGTRLVHRSTRRLAPTPAGDELFFRRARLILAETLEAREAVARLDGVPRGLLRISVPPGAGGTLLAQTLLEYMDRYPEVQLEVTSASRHVDLVAEGYHLAVRAGTIDDPTLIARRVWTSDVHAVASPAYLAARGTPQHPRDLADYDCIVGFDRGEVPARSWPLIAGGRVPVHGRLVSNDLSLSLAAALDGKGLALVPARLTATAVAEGQLVPVLVGQVGAQSTLALVYPSREHLDPKVRAFVDLAVPQIQAAVESGGFDSFVQAAVRPPTAD